MLPHGITRSRAAAFATLLLALGLAGGCGGKDPLAAPEPTDSPTVGPSTPLASTTPIVPSETPTPTPSPTPTPTKATPTQDPGDQVGDGDADESGGPATAGGGVCGKLSAGEVGMVLGGTVKGAALGGVPGCKFTQSDARAYAATITDQPYKASEGMATARNDATSAVEGTPENLTGIGSAAFVVTGTMFGGSDLQGAGAVHVGSRLVSVTLNQEKGISRAKVRDRLVAMLKLVVREIG